MSVQQLGLRWEAAKTTPTREFIRSAIVNPDQDRPDLTDLARSPRAASFVRQEIRLAAEASDQSRLIRLQRAARASGPAFAVVMDPL